MVTGIESFKEWFKGNESQYAIIGGTACDILMTEEGLDFRATKDIDLVLIIEAVDAAFGRKFWDYVKQAGYEHRNKSSRMCRSKDLYSLSVNRQKSKNRTLFSTTAEFWWRRRFTDLTVRL